MNFIHTGSRIAAVGGLIYALLILADLSKRLGDVSKNPPLYRGLHIAAGFLALAGLGRAILPHSLDRPLLTATFLETTTAEALLFLLPLAVGMTISLYVVWYYWGWLIKEG